MAFDRLLLWEHGFTLKVLVSLTKALNHRMWDVTRASHVSRYQAFTEELQQLD